MHYCLDDLDRLICEDMPYFDLTAKLLDIKNNGTIEFASREDILLSGNMLVSSLANRVGLEIVTAKENSKKIKANEPFFKAKGRGEDILTLWKVAQNIFEYACGVATYTHKMVSAAKTVNPDIEILTTRKIIPFTKKVALQAVMDGGAYPHRITTSETILVFENYIELHGGWERFVEEFKKLKAKSVEKKWVVEAKDMQSAQKFIDIEVDVLQLDKVDIQTTKKIVNIAKQKGVKVISAGGVDVSNVKKYASTGVDAIITTSPYYADRADIKVSIKRG